MNRRPEECGLRSAECGMPSGQRDQFRRPDSAHPARRNPRSAFPHSALRTPHSAIVTALFLACAPAAFAEVTNTLTLRTDLPNVGASAIRALGALAIVLALFFAGVWVFRNGQRAVWRRTGVPKLAILESRSLGNRLAIYVVGYEQQRLLVGSSPAGLSLLTQLPTEEAPVGNAECGTRNAECEAKQRCTCQNSHSEGAIETAQPASAPGLIRRILHSALRTPHSAIPGASVPAERASFADYLQQVLKRK